MKTNYRIDITNNLKAIGDVLPSDVGSALYIEAEKVMTDSKTNYVPVVSGALKKSGIIMKPEFTANKISVLAGFGSDTVDYAAVVHEAPASYGQGKRKYLSQPLQQAIPKMGANIATIIRNRTFSRKVFKGTKSTWKWSA